MGLPRKAEAFGPASATMRGMNEVIQQARFVAAFEDILRSWLPDPDTLVFCGHWRDGGLMELVPRGAAVLTEALYEPPFDGLRELRVGEHHVHLDLARLGVARYVIEESVCYGYRPSFEMRLMPRDATAGSLAVGFSVGTPYSGGHLDEQKVMRYLDRAAEHAGRYGSIVALERPAPRQSHDPCGDHARIASLIESLQGLRGLTRS